MAEMDEASFMAEIVPLLFGPAYVAANEKRLRAFARGRLRKPLDPDGLQMQWEALSHFDGRSRLSEIAHPTLILHGQEDALTPFGAAEALLEGLPNAQLLGFEGVGHSPQVEAWRAFNSALAAFLDDPSA
jgi:pimeloyl-ACP methyl ester carboxylesterase